MIRINRLRSSLVRAAFALVVSIAALSTAAVPARADETSVASAVPVASLTVPYANLLRTLNPHLALAQSAAYAETVLQAARRFHVDPNLVVALVSVESSWRPSVSSIHGARGLGQLLPGTARDLGVDAWSGRENLRGTALYLHKLLGTFRGGRDPVRAALAGYNAGPYAVIAAGGRAPNYEARHYVVKVMHMLAVVRSRVAHLLTNDPDAMLLDDAAANEAPSAQDLTATLSAIDAAQSTYWGAKLAPGAPMPTTAAPELDAP